ncbi:hypothetical protein J437_LFUL013395 [Ladona fulva]|uniref:B3/B4 tRNA-binding domain-containing protein n=1 Tax=Ladona fulva TaxID=123851 RepID=A0A8K0KEB4_LADFU|nr:hypothetical protein J437_LFUL013395 [Ladona fulva]
MDLPEIDSVTLENRHELVLVGDQYYEKYPTPELQRSVFSLKCLNYLSITKTSLDCIPDEISNLSNLKTLVLHSNQICDISPSIGKLEKLKMLDLSRNKLSAVPREIAELTQLTSLQLATNSLVTLPSFECNVKLIRLDTSWNRIETFPDLCYEQLTALTEVDLNGNQIKEVPLTISVLPSLKQLNLSNNLLTNIPAELADAPKLKELMLAGNKLNDKRLYKLVDQCHYKQVLDYIRQHCPRSSDLPCSGGKGKKGKKGKKAEPKAVQIEEVDNISQNPCVTFLDEVKAIRGYIICCIIRNLKFTDETLKRFIQVQTKLHDGVCGRRNLSTIATHDLDKIPPGNLTYTAMPPDKIIICPLLKDEEVTASSLYSQLQDEAEALRKEKKRSAYSGIHRYLYLLEGKPLYPCLLDSEGKVISFPPITNSDVTKLSTSTTGIFVEVTSAVSLGCCKTAMQALLEEAQQLGIGDDVNKVDESNHHYLRVEQVRIVNHDGLLRHVYPSRADLNLDSKGISVIRQ